MLGLCGSFLVLLEDQEKLVVSEKMLNLRGTMRAFLLGASHDSAPICFHLGRHWANPLACDMSLSLNM